MTNGGGPHGPKKKAATKKAKPKDPKAALKRKGWIASGTIKVK